MKQKTWIIGTVAAMLAASSPALWAQDATATPDASAPVAPVAFTPLNIAPIAAPPQIDYSVLMHQPFTYFDLMQAKYAGLSDSQIAAIGNISDKTGLPFHLIREQVQRGATFPMLATKYGLSLDSLYNVGDEEQEISNFEQAYQTTGYGAMKAMPAASDDTGMMSGTDTSSTMPATPAPMAPPAAPSADTTPSASTAPVGDVVDVAMATPRLSTFVKAVQAAGLVDTLKGPGPFTIFAPDNAAFRKLPKGTLKSLMADPTALANILQYHVISGQKIDAATAMSMTSPTSPPTVQGGTLNVVTSSGSVMINDAKVVQPDVQATNGIIHIINRVLMPPAATTAPTPTPAQ